LEPSPTRRAIFCRGPRRLGPGNLAINKDTKLGFLGENGNLQFRAEIFNLLNRANFWSSVERRVWRNVDEPSLAEAPAANIQAPTGLQVQQAAGTVGQITPRQPRRARFQLALKVIF